MAGYLGLGVGCASLTLFYLALRKFLSGAPSYLPGVGVFALALSPYFLRHSASGMETVLVCLLYTMVIYAAVVFPLGKQLPAIGVVVPLAISSYLVRPDAPIFTLATLVPLVFFMADEKKVLRSGAVLVASLFGIGITAAVSGRYFTTVFPLPAYLKLSLVQMMHHPSVIVHLIPVVLSFQMELCSVVSIWIVLMLVATMITEKPFDIRLKAICIGGLTFFIYLFTVIPIMNFQMRYQVPLLIPAIFVGIAGLAILSEHYNGSWNTRRLFKPSVCVVTVLSTFGSISEIRSAARDSSHDHQVFKRLGKELSAVRGLSLASSEAGVLAYSSDARFLDLIGLNNTFVALNHRKPGYEALLNAYLSSEFGYPDLYIRKIGYVDPYADLCTFPTIISRYSFVGEVNGAGSPGIFVLRAGPKAGELIRLVSELKMLPASRAGVTRPMTTMEGCAAATEGMNSDSQLRGE